jgi:hypothetical protein
MPSIRFDSEHVYPDDATGGITLSIELQAVRSVRLFAYVDTGAANCLFQGDYAELLGLTLTDGFPKYFYPAGGGSITAFGHHVTIKVFDYAVDSMVFFTDHPEFTRNVLGRQGWLHHFKVGLIHYESKLYLGKLGS